MFVPEYLPTGREPGNSMPELQATYWAEVNAQRWVRALELEADSGVAVCDSDPLKLHYSWCLAAIGAAPFSRFEQEVVAVRHQFAQRRLGFADVVLLSLPGTPQLMRQRHGDPTRRRRNFELHVRLAEPLSEWYDAVDRLDPGRVRRGYPSSLELAHLPPPRPDRDNPCLLDGLLDELPRL